MERLMTCPKCGNPQCDIEDAYCFNCGVELKNYCSNPECIENAVEDPGFPHNYCFCPSCGSETTYKKNGHITPMTFPL